MLNKLEYVNCSVCGSENTEVDATGKDYLYSTTEELFTWVRCIECDHLYLNPRPSYADLAIIYPPNLLNYVTDRKGLAWYLKRKLDTRMVQKIVGSREITSILDVGCADGELMKVLRDLWGDKVVIEGTEIAPTATSRCGKVANRILYGEVKAIQHDLAKYDLIFMQQVVEHLINPEQDLRILLAHLNPNGLLVVETPLQGSWDYRIFQCLAPGVWEGFHIPRHFNVWSQFGFSEVIERVGGEIVEINRKIKPVHWTVSIQNYLKSKSRTKSMFFFSNKNIPILCAFAVLDLFQILAGKGSDVRYVIQNRSK